MLDGLALSIISIQSSLSLCCAGTRMQILPLTAVTLAVSLGGNVTQPASIKDSTDVQRRLRIMSDFFRKWFFLTYTTYKGR